MSCKGWVFATKTSGTSASTSIAPDGVPISESLIFFPSSVIEISVIVEDASTIKSGRFFKDSKGIESSFESLVFISSSSVDSLHFLRNFSSRDSSVLSVNEIVVEFSFF